MGSHRVGHEGSDLAALAAGLTALRQLPYLKTATLFQRHKEKSEGLTLQNLLSKI